jgi:hypothetical protein
VLLETSVEEEEPWFASLRGIRFAALQKEKAFIFHKLKMKASTNSAINRMAGWPHPSLCGEVSLPR